MKATDSSGEDDSDDEDANGTVEVRLLSHFSLNCRITFIYRDDKSLHLASATERGGL
jgi:hypothetical protein